ncbi:sugar transferase [Deinococcus sp. 6YEL10]|uniref:sugar transferase n=1 Tax=Deinococcus sp. 6YEL10 TaxID=2745870 RepID=UPI002714B98E|nr:sugar transferase [Deinococcus sp. 6YEL10]MCD0160625.1 sugar transferase [Deinococcus sp. 6YEL10]
MPKHEKSILFAVTSSVSLVFLRGHTGLLARRGWRTGVSAAPAEGQDMEGFSRQEQTSTFPVQMEREINLKADLKALVSVYRTIRNFRPTITNVGTPKAGLIGGLAAAAARVPVRIYTLHGLRLETVQGNRGRLLKMTERLAMACAHRVVCVSPSLRDRVHELGLAPAHKTVVLGSGSPNGVRRPTATDPAATAAYRNDLGLREDSPVIGFVGRFTRDKGLAELMQAFKEVQKHVPVAQLLLIGDYEVGDPVAPEIRDLVEQTPGVIRTGFVPDVYPYYPLMKVLALPTYREGFPTVALEACAFGLPLVTTDATGARDAVQDGVTGWRVPVGDADALARALIAALTDPLEAHRRGEAGRAWVTEQFDPEIVQQQWMKFYDSMLQIREAKSQYPFKRPFDILVAGAALIILSIPMSLLALLIRIKLGGPVIFKQVRPGLNAQPFTIYKFRTMTNERDASGNLLPDGIRLTKFGRLLRSSSLDELPGLWNVLRGDMSIVGPRPLVMEYLPYYTEEQNLRHAVRPGITGLAQVSGRNYLPFSKRLQMDVEYVRNISWPLDISIILRTAAVVFKRKDVSHGESVAIVDDIGLSKDLNDNFFK